MVEQYSNIVTHRVIRVLTHLALSILSCRERFSSTAAKGDRRRVGTEEGWPLRLKRMLGGKGGKSLRRRDGINRRSDRCKVYDQRKLESATALP